MTIKTIFRIFKHLKRLDTIIPSKIIPKKLLYLPINNNIIKSNHFLPLNVKNKKEIINNVSGIYNPPKNFFHITFLKENKELFIKMIIKFCYNLFYGEKIFDYENLLKSIDDFLKQSVIFQQASYYVLCQHILVSVFAKITIPSKFLLKNELEIDYTSYGNNNITVNRIIEHIVVEKTSGNFIKKHNVKVIAQNPENPISTKDLKVEYFINLSKKQLNQMYADFFFFEKEKIYASDVKFTSETAKFKLCKGHLTLMQTQYLDLFMQRYIGEFAKKLNIFKNNIKEETLAKMYYADLIDIKKNKKMPIIQKFILFQNIQNNISLTTPLIFSKVACTLEDDAFSLFYQKYVTNIDQIVAHLIKELDLEIYIPEEGQKVFISEWKELIRNVIKLMPKDVRSNMESNLEALEILENTVFENSTQNLTEYKEEQSILDDIIDKSINKF